MVGVSACIGIGLIWSFRINKVHVVCKRDVLKRGGNMQVSSARSTVCVKFIPVRFKDIVVYIAATNMRLENAPV